MTVYPATYLSASASDTFLHRRPMMTASSTSQSTPSGAAFGMDTGRFGCVSVVGRDADGRPAGLAVRHGGRGHRDDVRIEVEGGAGGRFRADAAQAHGSAPWRWVRPQDTMPRT